jgi:hypothetical protein
VGDVDAVGVATLSSLRFYIDQWITCYVSLQ